MCILKGNLTKPLVDESRAGSTNTNDSTDWLVLDLDGLPEFIETKTPNGTVVKVPATIELILNELGLHDVSYVLQWSASYMITDKRIRAHVYFQLDRMYAAPLLKQWLIQKNHEVPYLSNAMELTKTCNSIRWPLDISACQNDKLIYIAPPVLKGIKDPVKNRISLVKKKYDILALASTINSTEKNKELTKSKVNELRAVAGLPAHIYKFKYVGNQEVMLKPDVAIITEMKSERGFVYFNLNGGDSWGYYHPENNPDYILNFKGEPAYLTKELLPDYWDQLQVNSTRVSSTGLMYLAFLDRKTSNYWRGSYDTVNDTLELDVAKNETQLRHFAKQHGMILGDYIPEWTMKFAPNDHTRVDPQNCVINRFAPSIYMKHKPVSKVTACPPTIFKMIHHALGTDIDITEHFMNWLAFILQHRDRTGTAWVWHGVQGTCKGIVANKIIKPLFGAHTAARRMEELADKYNHFMSEALVVFVDEVQIKALGNNTEKGIMAKLKGFITEETVPMRAMYQNASDMRNYTNWIFMSNMPDPVLIDKNDRRFNVGKFQASKAIVTDAELAQISKELQAFHDYLMTYVVDADQARTVMQTADRTTLISISESSVDTAATALLEGDFKFFLDQMPTDTSHLRNAVQSNRVDDYTTVIKALLARTSSIDGRCNIAREELRTLFDYVCGNMPNSPNKFTSMMKHHRVHTKAVWVSNKTVNGVSTVWTDFASFGKYSKEFFPSPTRKAAP